MSLTEPGVRLRPVHKPLRFATLRVVVALILREMSSTYGRKPGGYVWSILEPVAGIVLLAWIFSLVARKPQLGHNFMMFYATGLLPFFVFFHVSLKVSQSLTYSRQLLAYPRVTIVDAIGARYLLNLASQLLIATLILTGVRGWYDTGTMLVLPRALLGFGMAAALAGGVGVMNCFLLSMFPIWQSVWAVVTRPIVLISGVIFLIEDVPEPYFGYLAWNPIAHVVAQVRMGFYYGYDPGFVAPAYVFGVSLGLGAAGLLFLWRHYRRIQEI